MPEAVDAIVGYKGRNNEYDAGIILSPYTPALSTGVTMDATTFAPVIEFMTRYGITFIENNEIEVDNWRDYYFAIKFNDRAENSEPQLLQEATASKKSPVKPDFLLLVSVTGFEPVASTPPE